MAPYYKIAKNTTNQSKNVKRTIKFLAIPHNQKINKEILKTSSDSVIKAICNAAYNIHQNPELQLAPKERKLFHKHRHAIYKLTSPKISIPKKRRIIQRGGGPFLIALLPAILSTAISALGSAFINANARK